MSKKALRNRLPQSPGLSRRPRSLRLNLFGAFFLVAATSFGFEVGKQVPKVSLGTAQGKKIDLSTFAKDQGKKNLLLLFFRTGTCGICLHQLQDVAAHFDEISKANTAVAAISLDDAIVQTRVAETVQNKYPILLDPDGKTVHKFGVFNPEDKLARPALFLIGADRKVLYRYVGMAISDRPPIQTVLDAVKHYSGLVPTKGSRDVSVSPNGK